jgi:hypothetical protein
MVERSNVITDLLDIVKRNPWDIAEFEEKQV